MDQGWTWKHLSGNKSDSPDCSQAPARDLVELLEADDVGCVVETKPGEFIDIGKAKPGLR